ncbi:hypothetical protein EDD85DRAFT_454149 [Armillaria nabsnona]|nr:hypothetical protein EDD85DRAFT_454149 [Armillaria nabsnona]
MPKTKHPPFVDGKGFVSFFKRASRTKYVLLIDDLDDLFEASEDILHNFLGALQILRSPAISLEHSVHGMIVAGTFSAIRAHKVSLNYDFSAFEITKLHPFSLADITRLFKRFEVDEKLTLDRQIIDNIYVKTGGHPAFVCLCGLFIRSQSNMILSGKTPHISFQTWNRIAPELHDKFFDVLRSLLDSLEKPCSRDRIMLLVDKFIGRLGPVSLASASAVVLADSLVAEGVLLQVNETGSEYRIASFCIEAFLRTIVLPRVISTHPCDAPPLSGSNLAVFDALRMTLPFFQRNVIQAASRTAHKIAGVYVDGHREMPVPRESVYNDELMRILSDWLSIYYGWSVTGQYHLRTGEGGHKYSDIVIGSKTGRLVVLELLATGSADDVQSHIDRTVEYKGLLGAAEAWFIHFTHEDNYEPIFQSAKALAGGIGVVHFQHDENFFYVRVSAMEGFRGQGSSNHERALGFTKTWAYITPFLYFLDSIYI